ncbi:unnamed protein product [Urochloa decumbens]|uniref:Uncharacterized protein n=1 Tax=Urochloa decumbens TaxID=240449 RepID=A0ABC9B2N3_9POAL
MKITIHSSKSVKPAYGSSIARDAPTTATSNVIPLTVFHEVNHNEYVTGIFTFNPPAPPMAALEAGLAKVLAEYRELAGHLVADIGHNGKRAIVLNDNGVRLMEASADVALNAIMPLRAGPEALELHPSCECTEELLLLQVTLFLCASFVMGCGFHHSIVDGYAISAFLIALGKAVRGMSFDPVPVHDRESLFKPRDPPLVEFEHRGVEFMPSMEQKALKNNGVDDDVVVETVQFSREFISQLQSRALVGERKPYSAVRCVVAHIWRCVTLARRLDKHEVTRLYLTVNGRGRMINPRVPKGYTGNVVLWACPSTTVQELVGMPLCRTVELVAQAVARVDDHYFRSFIDFASSGVVEREGLVPRTLLTALVMGADIDVDSELGIPFYDIDFGSGKPFLLMPTYSPPVEGAIYLVPAFSGDAGMVAYASLFRHTVDRFMSCCYSLPLKARL